MLGYAATTDVKDVPVVVADADRSPASRNLIARFDASRNFTVIDTVTSVREIDRYLQQGDAWVALAIPTGYGASVLPVESPADEMLRERLQVRPLSPPLARMLGVAARKAEARSPSTDRVLGVLADFRRL